MNKQRLGWIVIGFGILNAIGGVIGFQVAHSLPSLIGGIVIGIILIGAGFEMRKKSVLPYFLATFISLLLLLFFSYRLIRTGKVAPAGIMALLSLGVSILLIAAKLKK